MRAFANILSEHLLERLIAAFVLGWIYDFSTVSVP